MFMPSNYRNAPYIRWLRKKALNVKSARIRIGT